MKLHRLKYAFFAAALAVAAFPVLGGTSVLTPYGVRYAIDQKPDHPQVEIIRAQEDARTLLVVPTTQDAGEETQAQLAYDAATDTLFVAWVRESSPVAEIRFVTLDSNGQWSPPRMIAAGSDRYRGMQLVLTHAPVSTESVATLVHAAWWSINATDYEPEYALFAFEEGHPVSAVAANLDTMAALGNGVHTTDVEFEPDAIFPPMAMARNGEAVEVAFGAYGSTQVTRLTIEARKITGDVRIWKPVGRSGARTPGTGIMMLESTPVNAIIVKGRLALYTASENFKFIVLRKDGTWSDMRVVRVDEDNTAADLVRDLHHTVEELLEHELDEEVVEGAAESR